MGGHGGLNILPQKRWNVYNFDNREKVRKDEEEAAEKERQQAEEQRLRDGEIRREVLLDRARKRRTELEAGPVASLASSETRPAELQNSDVKDGQGSKELQGHAVPPLPAACHINLFEVEEQQQQQSTAATAKVGRPPKEGKSSQDEKEDEKYKLGYGASKPWYAMATDKSSLPAASHTRQKDSFHVALATGGAAGTPADSGCDSPVKEKKLKSKSKQTVSNSGREKKRRREKSTAPDRDESARAREKAAALEKLRRERLQREQNEKLRTAKLLATHGQSSSQGQTGLPGQRKVPAGSRGYNSGYGYGR